MIVVEMISKDECHLCDLAREALVKAQGIFPFELRQTKIREGDILYETYGQRVPVVLINDEVAFQYKVREDELLAKLRSL